jgi:hypothetical protein
MMLADDTGVFIPTAVVLAVLAFIGAACIGILFWALLSYVRGLRKENADLKRDLREVRGYVFQIAQTTGTALQEPQHQEEEYPTFRDHWGGFGRRRH